MACAPYRYIARAAVWMVWGYGVPDDVTVIRYIFPIQQYQPVKETVRLKLKYKNVVISMV